MFWHHNRIQPHKPYLRRSILPPYLVASIESCAQCNATDNAQVSKRDLLLASSARIAKESAFVLNRNSGVVYTSQESIPLLHGNPSPSPKQTPLKQEELKHCASKEPEKYHS